MNDPRLVHAFDLHCEAGTGMLLAPGDGMRGFTPILGGTVDGPRLHATILAGGGDWWARTAPDTVELDVRYLIQTEEGSVIDVTARGYYRTARAELLDNRLLRGEMPPADDLYYFCLPRYRTDDPAYQWLAHTAFVGMMREEPGAVNIRFYAVE